MDYEITEEDIKFLHQVQEASMLVIEMYDRLAFLDENGRYGTNEYFKALDDLKVAISLEDEIMAEIENDFDCCVALTDYIDKLLKIKNTDDEPVISLNLYISSTENKTARSIIRIRNKLFSYIRNIIDASNDTNILMEQNDIDFGVLQIMPYDKRIKIAKKITYMEAFFADIIHLISVLDYDVDEKEAINFKYLLSSLLKKAEDDNLKNNFALEINPYLGSIFVGQYLGYNEDELDQELVNLGIQLALGAIDLIALKLLNNEDINYNLLLMRSINVLMGKKHFEDLEEELCFEDCGDEVVNELASDLIIDAFSKYEDDMSKPRFVSFTRIII